jgi:hypothetical protein
VTPKPSVGKSLLLVGVGVLMVAALIYCSDKSAWEAIGCP